MPKRGAAEIEITNDNNINGKRPRTDLIMAKRGGAESEITKENNIIGKRPTTDPTMAKTGAAEIEITNDNNINGKRPRTDPTMATTGAAEIEITNDNNIDGKRPRTDPTMATTGAAEIEITNDNNINGKRPSKRRRVEIKKVEEKNKRHVTFSKRKRGLFNKAAELSVLSGAEIAGIVVSSNGKVFCFGSPSADTVIHRYLRHNASSLLHASHPDIHHDQNGDVRYCPYNISSHVNILLNGDKQVEDYMEARRHMESETIKRVNNNNIDKVNDIDNSIDGERGGWCYGWWEKPIEMTTSLEELKEYMAALRKLKHNVEVRTYQMVMNVGNKC